MRRRWNGATLVCAVLLLARADAGAQPGRESLADLLDRVGRRVEDYFARAASVVATETVTLQPIGRDFSSEGFARRLVFELRVSWEPPEPPSTVPDVSVLREIVKINGRAPRINQRKSDEDAKCLDPKAVSPEPLEMLLPGRRGDFAFTAAGRGRTDGRSALMIDYRSTLKQPPTITWLNDTCGSIDMPAYIRGRIWIDPASSDVLRLDERLQGYPEVRVPPDRVDKGFAPVLRVERADSSIRYKVIKFADPDEYLLLPASMESLTIIIGSGTPRRRTTHTYTDYKRFLTRGRVVTRP
jgi:hypothetical protein